MDKIKQDFQIIFDVVTGNAKKEEFKWAENAFVEGTNYNAAYAELWKARENLCRRFGIDWEDEDLERVMNAVLKLEKDLAWRMFCCGLSYAKKE